MFNFYVSVVSRKKVFFASCRYVLHMPLDNRGWKKVEFYPKLFQSENDVFEKVQFSIVENSQVPLSKQEKLEGIVKGTYLWTFPWTFQLQ